MTDDMMKPRDDYYKLTLEVRGPHWSRTFTSESRGRADGDDLFDYLKSVQEDPLEQELAEDVAKALDAMPLRMNPVRFAAALFGDGDGDMRPFAAFCRLYRHFDYVEDFGSLFKVTVDVGRLRLDYDRDELDAVLRVIKSAGWTAANVPEPVEG